MESIVGKDVAGYRVEALVARGGMGVVYRARQRTLDRPVALKVIAPELAQDPLLRSRFVRESRLAASIDHPNVVPIYEADEYEGLLFIAMRFVEGRDLKLLLAESGPLAPERASRLVTQIAAGLDAAHARGLIHRDVKPANVLVTSDDAGGPEHAYLTDFGLVKRSASDSGMTKPGSWAGTLDYVAPEQLRGDPVDARADVYALGCLLFEVLTGRVPFPRESDVAKLWAHISDPPPSLAVAAPYLPPAIDAVIAKALAKSPDDRYSSAGQLASELTDVLAGGDTVSIEAPIVARSAAPAPEPPSAPSRRARRSIAAGVLATAAAAIGTLAANGAFSGSDGTAEAARQAVVAHQQSVGAVCEQANRVQAARLKRFEDTFEPRVRRARALSRRLAVIIEETQARLSATGDLISRLEATSPPAGERTRVHNATVAAWDRNYTRSQKYRDRLLHVSTADGLQRVFRRVPTSANERDAKTVVAGLLRLGGPACDLKPTVADPPLPGNESVPKPRILAPQPLVPPAAKSPVTSTVLAAPPPPAVVIPPPPPPPPSALTQEP